MSHANALSEIEHYLSEQIAYFLCTSWHCVSILSIGGIEEEWFSDKEDDFNTYSKRTFSWRLCWAGEDKEIIYGRTHKSEWVSDNEEDTVYFNLTAKEKKSLLEELEIIGRPGLK